MKPLLNDKGVIARYREFLPVTAATPVVSLSEGSTPVSYTHLTLPTKRIV